MSICPHVYMSTCPYVHMDIWTCGHIDIQTYGYKDMLPVMQNMTIYITVYGLYEDVYNNVLKTLKGNVQNKIKTQGICWSFLDIYSLQTFCHIRRYVLIRLVSVDILSENVLSHYTCETDGGVGEYVDTRGNGAILNVGKAGDRQLASDSGRSQTLSRCWKAQGADSAQHKTSLEYVSYV